MGCDRDLAEVCVCGPYSENELNVVVAANILMDIHIIVYVCVDVVEMGLRQSRIWWEFATTRTFVLCYFCFQLCVLLSITCSQLHVMLRSSLIGRQVSTQIVKPVSCRPNMTTVLNQWARYCIYPQKRLLLLQLGLLHW